MAKVKGPLEAVRVRQSNVELLRIVSMLMVVAVHANYWAIGQPSVNDLFITPIPTVTRIILESLNIICVNVFILISGYFTIKQSCTSFCSFIFQCLFYYLGIYLISTLLGTAHFNIRELLTSILLSNEYYWFVRSYIVLYIISPVLNKFVGGVSKQHLISVIFILLLLQTVLGWLFSMDFFAYGYSPLSFCILYLIGSLLAKCKHLKTSIIQLGGGIW